MHIRNSKTLVFHSTTTRCEKNERNSQRMKNKWMNWGVKGAENLAGLVIKRIRERKYCERFPERVMKKVSIRWEVNLHQ